MSQQQPSFRMPDFLRSIWASDPARDAWKPKLDAIRDAWPHVAIEFVAGCAAECAFRALPPRMIFGLQAEAKRRGVTLSVLGVRGVTVPCYAADFSIPRPGKPFLYDVAFGTQQAAQEMETLWERRDYPAVYRLAGFPECCVAAFQQDVQTSRVDPVGKYAGPGGVTDVDGDALAGPLWRWLNIEPVGCPPCSLHCAGAIVQSNLWISVAADCGYPVEMDWLRNVFSWPVEWSALHGIAELKTPVVKAVWSTDASNQKLTLRYHGKGYPREGATGLCFPYRPSETVALTSSSAFRRGMENPIRIG